MGNRGLLIVVIILLVGIFSIMFVQEQGNDQGSSARSLTETATEMSDNVQERAKEVIAN